jgi:hypothetical protein
VSMWLHYGQKDSKVSFIKWISKNRCPGSI